MYYLSSEQVTYIDMPTNESALPKGSGPSRRDLDQLIDISKREISPDRGKDLKSEQERTRIIVEWNRVKFNDGVPDREKRIALMNYIERMRQISMAQLDYKETFFDYDAGHQYYMLVDDFYEIQRHLDGGARKRVSA